MVYKSIAQLADILFPSRCRLCDRLTGTDLALCADCQADLPWLHTACHRCARPLDETRKAACGSCQRQPPAFDSSMALFYYSRPVDYLVKQLKFSGDLRISRLFADLLASHAGKDKLLLPDLLLPVPLHVSRLRERGFNQSLEICRHLHREIALDWQPRLCRRLRATQPQSLLPANARRSNLRNAFVVDEQLTGEHVTIIDDVMTSGHTCSELAGELKRAGAGRVDVWVVARAGWQP